MSSEQPTGDFPQPIGQQPLQPSDGLEYIPSLQPPPLTWSAPLATPLPHVTPYPEAQEVVPSVNPGPGWGSIANGIPVPEETVRLYPMTKWSLLSHDKVGSGTAQIDYIAEGTYIEGMGTLVRAVATLSGFVSVSTSFLPGVKIADGKLVPFNYEC